MPVSHQADPFQQLVDELTLKCKPVNDQQNDVRVVNKSICPLF